VSFPAIAHLAAIWRTLPERLQWRILWLLNPKFTVGVSGVVLDESGRVLLLRHTFRRRYPWGLLGGWVKGGESLEEALHREAQEETGLSISIDRMVTVRKDRYSLFLEAVFACRVTGGTFRRSNEISEIRWCAADALPAGTHPHHAPLISGVIRG
jgi:8-oxo-dGTP diphosphatase